MTLSDVYTKSYSRFIRGSLGLSFSTSFDTLSLNISNAAYYRPAYNLESEEFEFDNADVENTLTFDFAISDFISFSYENQFTWDRRNKSVKKLPSTDLVHTAYLNFSYIY